ncbi:MAG: hypothetical protein V1926_05685 [Candidatus Peregrinibacteria bacterium]
MVKKNSCSPAEVDFQGKDPGETFQFYFHQHWIRLLLPFVKLIVWNILIFVIGALIFATPTIADINTRRIILIFMTLFFLIAHFEFLVRFYRYFLKFFVVTDRKIHRIKKSLIAVDDHQSIDLWVLQDINKLQHGIIQNILKFGSLELEAQETIMRIHFIPKIAEKYERIMRLREQAREFSAGAAQAPWRKP